MAKAFPTTDAEFDIQRGADTAIEFGRIKNDKKLWPKVQAELKKRVEQATEVVEGE